MTGINDPDRRLRVLHVIQNLNYGGMERLLADIVQGVDRNRFESHILVLQYLGRFAEGLESVATLHRADPMSRLSMLRPVALQRQIEAIAPDVVHLHSGVWYKASLAARMANVPWIVYTEHGRQSPDPFQARLLDGLASRRTDVAVAVSDPVAAILRDSVTRGRCEVQVILNGTDTAIFRPSPRTGYLHAELGIDAATPLLGSVGRLEPIKGYDIMVEAMGHFVREERSGPQPVLVIVGDGSERERLQRRVDELEIGSRVRLLGWRDDTREILSDLDLFTMSSRSEGTSVSLLEAMSCGLCPVVTEVGGNAAVLGKDLRQRLVPSERADLLATAWRVAFDDREGVERDGALGRERILECYSAAAMVNSYERLYARSSGGAVAHQTTDRNALRTGHSQIVGR